MVSREQANRTADNILEMNQLRRQVALVDALHQPYTGIDEKGTSFTICCHDEILWPCPTHKIIDGHYIAPPVTEL